MPFCCQLTTNLLLAHRSRLKHQITSQSRGTKRKRKAWLTRRRRLPGHPPRVDLPLRVAIVVTLGLMAFKCHQRRARRQRHHELWGARRLNSSSPSPSIQCSKLGPSATQRGSSSTTSKTNDPSTSAQGRRRREVLRAKGRLYLSSSELSHNVH